VAQHFIQDGILEVCGQRLQIVPVHRPKISDEPEQPSSSASETAVPVSPVIEVSWSQAVLSQSLLMMYLVNRKRSGGGQVKDMRFFAEDRKAFVTFVDAECKLLSCYLVIFSYLSSHEKIF